MARFDKAIKDELFGSIVYESNILTTIDNLPFKIVINKVWWYALRIFLETEDRLVNDEKYSTKRSIVGIKIEEFLNLTHAKQKAFRLARKLRNSSKKEQNLIVLILEEMKKDFNQIDFDFHNKCLFKIPEYNETFNIFKYLKSPLMKFARFVKITDRFRAKIDPDFFLVPGDHVQVKRSNIYYHAAIYIGNKKVIQVNKQFFQN